MNVVGCGTSCVEFDALPYRPSYRQYPCETIDTDVIVIQSSQHHIITIDLNRTVIAVIYKKAPYITLYLTCCTKLEAASRTLKLFQQQNLKYAPTTFT